LSVLLLDMKRVYPSGASKIKKKKQKVATAVLNCGRLEQFIIRRPNANDELDVNQQPIPTSPGTCTNDEIVSCKLLIVKLSILFVHSILSMLSTVISDDVPDQPNNTVIDADDPKKQHGDTEVELFEPSAKFPTDRGRFPQTITSANLKECIIQHGPCQWKGPYPKGEDGRPTFSEKYYSFHTTGTLKVTRDWLCYSPSLNKPYCQPCWLFADRLNPNLQWQWINGVSGSSRHLTKKLKQHETSCIHIAASAIYGRWEKGERLDQDHEKIVAQESNFWRQVLTRIINLTLTLASLNLPFRGHRETVSDGICEGGIFLSLIATQAQFDPLLQELIRLPARATKYLSPQIQNEIISDLSEAVKSSLITAIKASPFYAIIVDTTSDITRTDQVSVIIRWVDISSNKFTVVESFLGFLDITQGTAAALKTRVMEYLSGLGLDLEKLRAQGYDGASVMSGKTGGMQKLVGDSVTARVPFVHCAAHNLNLVIQDAVQASVPGVTFFSTLNEVYVYFGSSLNRWAELALSQQHTSSLKLKKLCPTRWSSRVDAVRAVKNRYVDILKVLTRICLESKNAKERGDAMNLRKQVEKFEFVIFLVIWEKILVAINKASVELQGKQMDLSRAATLLSMAHGELQFLRVSWENIVLTAQALAGVWNTNSTFTQVRARRAPVFHDELTPGDRINDNEERFKVQIFYPIVDTALQQLEWRFKGQKEVTDLFSFLYPEKLTNISNEDLEVEVKRLIESYPKDISEDLLAEIRAFRREFSLEVQKMSTVSDILQLLVELKMVACMSELCTACVLFITIPVTVASCEWSFSKLKLIKTYLRSTISQERMAGLALLSIENEQAKILNKDELITAFANKKSRREIF
jgi:hypothetical protein